MGFKRTGVVWISAHLSVPMCGIPPVSGATETEREFASTGRGAKIVGPRRNWWNSQRRL